MTDYISREAAILAVWEEQGKAYCHLYEGTHVTVFAFDVKKRIEAIPAADVRPVVRGRWIKRRFSEDVYGAECSVCHTTWDYGTNFCPSCGADMGGGTDMSVYIKGMEMLNAWNRRWSGD